jgi:hypothetical protein
MALGISGQGSKAAMAHLTAARACAGRGADLRQVMALD